MRSVVTGIMFILAITLIGCPSQHTAQLARPVTISVRGVYVHDPSGITFPENVGAFQREAILRYDADGKDVSVGYNLLLPSSPVAATIFVYPGPRVVSIGSPPEVVRSAKDQLMQREFKAVKQTIIEAHPGARLITEDKASLVHGNMVYHGRKATFHFVDVFAGREQDLLSQAYVFSYKKWTIKYRITYPKDAATPADTEIDSFMRSFRWPAKGS